MQNIRAYFLPAVLPAFLAVASPATAQTPQPSSVAGFAGGLHADEKSADQEQKAAIFAEALFGNAGAAYDLFRAANSAGDKATMAIYAKVANDDGNTLLHKAAQAAQVPYVNLLLDHGADTEARNKDGHTPLQMAVIDGWDNGDQSTVNQAAVVLIARGADKKIKDQYGNNLLHLATQKGLSSPVLTYLLSQGFDPDAQDNDGWTAMSSSISWNDLKSVNILLLEGANPNLKNNKGETPMQQFVRTANKWIDGNGYSTGYSSHGGYSPDNMWDVETEFLKPKILVTLGLFIEAGGTLEGINLKELRPSLREPLVRGVEARDKARASAEAIRKRPAGFNHDM